MYKVNSSPKSPQTYHVHCLTLLAVWHSHLGHPASQIMLHALKDNVISFSSSSIQCVDCLANKSHKLSFSRSTLSNNSPLEIIYSDIWDLSQLL